MSLHGQHQLRFFQRGPSPLVRLVLFVLLSFLLMFIDARYKYLESLRSVLSIVVSPVQRLATWPSSLWQKNSTFFSTQQDLVEENKQLNLKQQQQAAQMVQFKALQQENALLRQMLELPARTAFKAQMAEILYADPDVFKRKILINKGAESKIQAGQIIMDEHGIIGQVTRVYLLLSEVTLITEKDHAVPVQVQRNGLRSIAFGAGDTSHMSLRYMPVNSDIQEGDILETSGIDGVYMPGIPVAKVTRIERDAAYPFARVTCEPLGGVDKNRYLLVLMSQPALPERPVEEQQPVEETNPAHRTRPKVKR